MALGSSQAQSDGEEQGEPPVFLSSLIPESPGLREHNPQEGGRRVQGLI